MRAPTNRLTRYSLALLATAVALALRVALAPALGEMNPFHTAWAAVVFSAWYCGLGPSILTVITSALGVSYLFLPPYHTFAIQRSTDIFGFTGFLILSGFIVAMGESNRRSRSLQSQQSSLLDLANDAIIELDALDDRVKYWNRGAEQLYGWSRSEVAGQPIHTLLKTVFPTSLEETKAELIRHGNWQGELIHTRRDGTQIYVNSHWTFLGRTRRDSASWMEINRDITEKKKAEQELQKVHAELENRVADRTAELAESNQLLRLLSVQLLRTQDDERRRIARELHDGVGQYLAGISMTLESLKSGAAGSPALLAQKIEEATRSTEACISEVRTMSHLLHPPLIEELGLASAAQWFVEGFATRSGIRTEIHIPENLRRLGDEIEIVLFRVLQESLTNIYRHSGSKTAIVDVGMDSQQVWLEIRDRGNGAAKPSQAPFRPGMGITGMRERVKDIGGVLEIASGGEGTRVRAVIPLRASPEKRAAGSKESAAAR